MDYMLLHKGWADNLWPALIECFAIIALGYIMARLCIMNQTQAHGLGTYLSKLALPALLFRSLAVVEFGQVNWMFLLCMLLAKFSVFVMVGLLSLLITRHLGKSAIYSIFSTQSNDIALGYPIVDALYPSIHGHSMMVSYLYLIQPINLVLLNPLGFLMLEVHRLRRMPANQRQSRFSAVWKVLRRIASNPVVFMSVLGVVANFALHGEIPDPVDRILKTLGDSFSAVALFFLGFTMLGKVSSLTPRTSLTALLLISAKMLLLPLISRFLVIWFLRESPTCDVKALSSFAFFYGTFPTAPMVFLFSNQFRIAQTVISTSVVLCTFLALPVMFMSAMMLMLHVVREMDYAAILNKTAFDVSWVTIASCVWVVGLLLLGRRARSVPHQFTLCLAIAQVVCVSALMWLTRLPVHSLSSPGPAVAHWERLAAFSCHQVAAYSCQSCVSAIALCTCAVRVRGLCWLMRYKTLLFIFCLGFPVLALSVILMTSSANVLLPTALPYSTIQVWVTITFASVNLLIAVGALIRLHRHDRSYLGARSRTTSESEAAQHPVLPDASAVNISEQSEVTMSHSEQDSEVSTSGQRSRRVPKRVRVRDNNCADCNGCPTAPSQGSSVAIEDLGEICIHNDETTRNGSQSNQANVEGPANESTPLLGTTELNSYTTACHNLDSDELSQYLCDPMEQICSSRQHCWGEVYAYMERRFYFMDSEERTAVTSRDEHHVLRHVILVVLLLLVQGSMLFLSIWRVSMPQISGLYIELEFVAVVLISGQGLFLLGVFGWDNTIRLYPVLSRLRERLSRQDIVQATPENQLSADAKSARDTFVTYHLQICRESILKCHWDGLRRYRCVFRGCDLITWLQEHGLARDRQDGVQWGTHLLSAGVLQHVRQRHAFYDLPYLYRFC